jgi:hypothetical protein
MFPVHFFSLSTISWIAFSALISSARLIFSYCMLPWSLLHFLVVVCWIQIWFQNSMRNKFSDTHKTFDTWQNFYCGSESSYIKGVYSGWATIRFTRWILYLHVNLRFTAFFHWQQCHFTAYSVQGSPNIAHNVNEPSAFCHFTGWPISYCSLTYLPHQSVCACGVTWHTVKLEVGVWQHCQ